MKKTREIRSIFAFWLAVLLTVPLLPARAAAAGSGGEVDLSQKGVRIGVGDGTVQEHLVKELFPEAELYYFQSMDAYQAVAQGKIDAYIYDKRQMELAVKNGLQGVRVLEEPVGSSTNIAFGISNESAIPDLESKVNRFIRELRQDGTLDGLYDRWVIRKEYAMPEIASAASPEYHLTVGTTGTVEPYSFFAGTELTGYDIELAYRLAAWLNADVTFEIYDYGSVVAAAKTGKVDLVAANLQITPERAEALTFSDILYTEENGVMVRDTGSRTDSRRQNGARWQDYNGKRIGVLSGPLMEDTAAEFFPDSEYLLFNSYPDCAAALLAGKIDGFLGDEPGMVSLHAENPEIDYIRDSLTENNYSFAFRKNDPDSAALCEELNEFLAKSWADGTMQDIQDIWLGADEDRKTVELSDLTGENGTVRVVTTSTDMPWSYVKDGKNVGYDIDLVARFCRERGYALELGDVDFAGRIPAIQSGRYDFTTDMNVTPEREEQVLFSDPTAHGGIVLAVLASDLALPPSGEDGADRNPAAPENAAEKGGSFLDGIRDSFEKTFLRENRWKLFLQGIGTTMLITVLSILFGTALGFAVYMLCRTGSPAANAITRFFVWLVQGMPVVVLLMILYYVVFADSTASSTAVAVVAFTLVFGAAVYGMLRSGVGAVPKGQTEAAYALGYGNTRTFFRIILPQAVPHFLPAYKGEIVALIKATAIVGYIAVQDLTKMGDIVRGRTYEAFFPLIAIAVIYFILAAALTFLVTRLERIVNPRRRKKADILKGVETHD